MYLFKLWIWWHSGYANTVLEDENAFDQSTQARTELLQNFLSAINVTRYFSNSYDVVSTHMCH